MSNYLNNVLESDEKYTYEGAGWGEALIRYPDEMICDQSLRSLHSGMHG